MSNYTHDNASASGIQLAHTMYGTHDGATMRQDSQGEGVGQATWSTAPYRPPKRRVRDDISKVLCSVDDCKAWPRAGFDYCVGHARQMGLTASCLTPECNASPKGESPYCRHHTPEPVDVDAG